MLDILRKRLSGTPPRPYSFVAAEADLELTIWKRKTSSLEKFPPSKMTWILTACYQLQISRPPLNLNVNCLERNRAVGSYFKSR